MGRGCPGRWRRLCLSAAILALAPAVAAQPIDNAREYADCMKEARTDPQAAFAKATSWKGLGGGEAAEHCAAAALFGLGQYRDAAMRFADLALETRRDDRFRAKLLAQSAQAWMRDGNPDNARTTLTTAIKLDPANPELLIDRSVIFALREKYAEARADLDRAVLLAPINPEAYALRAGANRLLGDLDAALADADRALGIDPDRPEGLLERGIIRRLRGDKAGARRDWMRLIEVAPDTEAAKAARANIEKMDLTGR